MASPNELPYSVNLWGSRPLTADDCWTGADFATLADAERAAANWEQAFPHEANDPGELWIEVEGPDVSRVKRLRQGHSSTRDDEDWRRETAMEAGMLHGVDGYNEVMGY